MGYRAVDRARTGLDEGARRQLAAYIAAHEAVVRAGTIAIGAQMPNSICRAVFFMALAAVATACTSVSMRQEATQAVKPPRLLSAGTLDLPHDCTVTPGAVYRADFVVGPDGAVESVSPGIGPQCARDALAEWIRTFRYEPGGSPSATTIDWMAVVARR